MRSDVQALRQEIQQVRDDSRHAAAARLDHIARRIDELAASIDALIERSHAPERAGGEIERRLASAENLLAIDAVSRFIRHAQLRSEPLVSVVLPTRNRPDHLRRAIDSVIAQRYTHWELLVVDDGGDADSSSVVDAVGDERVMWMRIERQGVCAARNHALTHASGEIIAYVDDDNVMDKEWLYAVVWAFEERSDVDVLYGGFVIDDLLRVKGASSGQLPRTFLHPWSREALQRGNLADIGAIAHRSGLPEARFDEGLRTMGDWELLVRLTADRDPLVLPAIACYYHTDAPNRLTGGPTEDADHARVIDRFAVLQR